MRFAARRWRRRLTTLGLASSAVLVLWIRWPLPAELLAPQPAEGLVVVDRFGEVLRSTRAVDGSRRRWLSIGEMDPDLLATFVAAEDRRFYTHHGVDPLALLRALRQDLGAGRVVSGASTITMQVARLLVPSGRTVLGKAAQVLWALRLDHQVSKQAILEQYLNRIPLGEAAIGVEAAAQLYFGVSARELSLGQAATLAGMATAPGRINPARDPAGAARRRDLVLGRLVRSHYETAPAIDRAAAEPIRGGSGSSPFLAPHFTSWVLGRGAPLRGVVSTSIDGPLQRTLEAEVRHTVAELRTFGAEQAAVVVLENRTGGILGWVGSPDFFDGSGGQVDMVVGRRQPGSTLKPFLYGLAFDRGFTPASILPDVATVFPTASGPYAPRNYDRRYRGPVRAREALGSSLNVPAVALASRLGVAPLLGVLQRAGFRSLDRRADFYGLGLALGNGEVTLLELANGYRALANAGVWRPVEWRMVPSGEQPGEGLRVVSTAAAAQVIDILADPTARLAGFGEATPLEFGFRAAGKTGTSRHFTDNWAVATTERFTVAVWVGNFTGRPMAGVSGVTGAGPLLQRAVLATARRYPPGRLGMPNDAGLVAVRVCRLSGMAAGHHCPAYPEWFRRGTVPEPDSWFGPGGVTLPEEYLEWAGRGEPALAGGGTGMMAVARTPTPAGLRITSLRNGDRFRFVPGVDPSAATVGLRAAGAGSAPIRWLVDGRPHRESRWQLELGRHRITAMAGTARDDVEVEVLP